MEIGVWIALGYFTQAIGLETSDASVCAFLCSLTVVRAEVQNAVRDAFLFAVMKLTRGLDEDVPSAGMLHHYRVAAGTALVAETTRETATQDKRMADDTTVTFPCTRDERLNAGGSGNLLNSNI